MRLLWLFLAGALLCNAVPHLTAGLRGDWFPSPFANPPGRGRSSPVVNFLWGALNLFLGLTILSFYPVELGRNWSCAALALGALALGVPLSRHFGAIRRR
jgi:hypothetical protein